MEISGFATAQNLRPPKIFRTKSLTPAEMKKSKGYLREASLSMTGGGDFLGGSDILYENRGGSRILRKKSGGVGYFARHMSKIFCYKNV